jgi:hypothetical protein
MHRMNHLADRRRSSTPALRLVGRPIEQGLVAAAQAKGREPPVVQQDEPLPVHLADDDVGTRVLDVGDTEGAAGTRVETAHLLEGLVHAGTGLADVARDAVGVSGRRPA